MATVPRQEDRRDGLSGRASGAARFTKLKSEHLVGWRRAAMTALPFAGLWWLFAGGGESWIVGLPCILLAAGLAGLHDEAPSRVRPSLLPGFLFWFVFQTVRGGIDVARRALMPSLPIAPGVLTYRTDLPSSARPWLANTITLLPGTLAARLDGDRIDIHTIEQSAAVDAEIERAERRIAILIGTHTREVGS